MPESITAAIRQYLTAAYSDDDLTALCADHFPAVHATFAAGLTKTQQPIGWAPDLNDGVRLNIRPFVTAGMLRSKFTINWKVDRGTNPDGSARVNDHHLTRSEKQAVRRSYP